MSLEWQKIGQEEQKVGYKYVTHKVFKMPDGTESDWTTIGRTETRNVAVIALTSDNKVVISRMFRPGPEKIMEELPGGFVDAGEELEEAALRELREETGYTTDEALDFLGTAYRDAYKNDADNYFLARNCRKVAKQQTDSNEFIEVDTISIEKLIKNGKAGKMTDAVAVLMAHDKLKEVQNG